MVSGRTPVLHEWSDREIRFHAVNTREPLTKAIWTLLEPQIRRGHGIWARIYLDEHGEMESTKIKNPMWDSIMSCLVVTLPRGADAQLIRNGFVPHLQLSVQLTASVKADMSVPVVKTLMPEELYRDFPTDEHIANLKLMNPILRDNLFEIHRCSKQEKARLLKIKTTDKVVQYLTDRNFELPYTSGEVTFMKDINWTAAVIVNTLLPGQSPPQSTPTQAMATPARSSLDMAHPERDPHMDTDSKGEESQGPSAAMEGVENTQGDNLVPEVRSNLNADGPIPEVGLIGQSRPGSITTPEVRLEDPLPPAPEVRTEELNSLRIEEDDLDYSPEDEPDNRDRLQGSDVNLIINAPEGAVLEDPEPPRGEDLKVAMEVEIPPYVSQSRLQVLADVAGTQVTRQTLTPDSDADSIDSEAFLYLYGPLEERELIRPVVSDDSQSTQ